ncbi:MAG: D-alanine--D-alanine ligase [Candidatus Saccharibacteria bacterium]|nr:D-alanine--D-alanine ligase [Candidatus Saccharibacteria bacterium]
MTKIQKHIEIVRSQVPGLSSLSRSSADAIFDVLTDHYETVGITTINNTADLRLLVSRQPDLVFMGMKYLPSSVPNHLRTSQKIWISSYLEQHGIAHTGSGQRAIEFELSKQLAKQRVLDAGIKTARFMVLRHGQPIPMTVLPLKFPLFVKPASLGGGKGIDDSSVVYNIKDLHEKITSLSARYSADVLIEEYLPGREFSVAVLRDEHTDNYHVMPIELVAAHNERGNRILSQKMKASNQEAVLSVTDTSMRKAVVSTAKQVFTALGARDYGRIDIRLDASGTPHFLEANLIPSLISGYGSFPKACKLNINLDYEEMILRIVRLGLARTDEIVEPVTISAFGETLPFASAA